MFTAAGALISAMKAFKEATEPGKLGPPTWNLPHQRDVLPDEGTLEAEAIGLPRTCLAREGRVIC
jgi:hypothetical protein